MDYVIIFIILLAYLNIIEKLNKLEKYQRANKREITLFKGMLNKEIEIELDDKIIRVKGILKNYDESWLALEVRGKAVFYYRINNVKSINLN